MVLSYGRSYRPPSAPARSPASSCWYSSTSPSWLRSSPSGACLVGLSRAWGRASLPPTTPLALCDHASVPPAAHRPLGHRPLFQGTREARRWRHAWVGQGMPLRLSRTWPLSLPILSGFLTSCLASASWGLCSFNRSFQVLACCAPLVPEEPFLASYLRSCQVLGWLRTSCTYVLSLPTLAPVSPAPLFLASSSLSHTRPPRGHDLSCIRSLLPLVGDHRLHQLADLCTNLFGCVVGDSSLVESSKDLSLGVLVPVTGACTHSVSALIFSSVRPPPSVLSAAYPSFVSGSQYPLIAPSSSAVAPSHY